MDKAFRGILGQPVVTVHELQVFASGCLYGLVAAVRYPGIFFVDDAEAAVHFFIFPADFQAGILASVIYYDYFHVLEGLFHGAVQTAPQIFFRIVDRYDK